MESMVARAASNYKPLARPTQNSFRNDRFDCVQIDIWLSTLLREPFRLLSVRRLDFRFNESILRSSVMENH